MNTLLTYEQQQKLVLQGLANYSVNKNLDTFKYARKVMFDYLWDTDAKLQECRGHTYDNTTGELVVAAPRKSFNYLENGHWKDMPLDEPVVAYIKYNGFMACVSKHNNEVIVSTTGSTKSDFVRMASEMVDVSNFVWSPMDKNHTYLYEIIHPNDLHIVKEEYRAKLLGRRSKITGVFEPSGQAYEGTLKGILAIAEVNQGEGFMVYRKNDVERLNPCKVKTPYYVGKKALMRMNKKNVASMYINPKLIEDKLPRYWKFAVQCITRVYLVEEWMDKTDQQRRGYLENLDEYGTRSL